MTDISWNLDALTNDAKAWNCVAARLADAQALMAKATISHRDFMAFLPSSGAAADAASTAVDGLKSFAGGGESRTRQGAQVLIEVRNAYEANEAVARAELKGLWEPDDS